ncbi:MAG TPA: hypothetical protein VD973_21880 [Symbiobacteriaceae bacterium]|nr:hypothetical protein [Symbiobacteriaceae bacterium]
MPGQSRKGVAPKVSDAIRAKLAQTVKAIRKDEAPVYRGNERVPIASIKRAYATMLLHGVGLINQAGKAWGLQGDVAALRFLKGEVAGYLLAEPLDKYDKFDPEQAELIWDADKKTTHVDMLFILQRLNKVVAPGYVSEVPLSLEDLPGHKHPYLWFHLNSAELRVEKEGTPRSKPDEDETEDAGDKANAGEGETASKKNSASKKRDTSKKRTTNKKGNSVTGDASSTTKETASAKATDEEEE